MSVVLSQGGN